MYMAGGRDRATRRPGDMGTEKRRVVSHRCTPIHTDENKAEESRHVAARSVLMNMSRAGAAESTEKGRDPEGWRAFRLTTKRTKAPRKPSWGDHTFRRKTGKEERTAVSQQLPIWKRGEIRCAAVRLLVELSRTKG
jgi:hypothetical protein